MISELLGVPAADRDKFRAWSGAVVSSVARPEQMRTAATEMIAYFTAQVEARRRSPGASDDLLAALVQARDQEDRLSTGELISMVFLLLVAGHETTVNLIASGTLALLLDPAAHARLRADRSLLPVAVEEMLRYTSPVNHATLRFTTEPTPLAGMDIPAGQIVIAGLSSANGMLPGSPSPMRSMWTGIAAGTWHSAMESTTAWVRCWPGWRRRSRSALCWTGSPT